MTGPGAPIRIVLVDDHAIVREGLKRVLERDEDVQVVGEAASAAEVAPLLERVHCDVVLLDVSMPGQSGLSLIPELRRSVPDIRILVLSMHDRPEYIVEAVRAGARGYVLKDMEPKQLRNAVRVVASGDSFFPQAVADRIGAGLREETTREEATRRLEQLTPRERAVFTEITRGATNQEIAERLEIGRRTVESHREHLMDKLGIHTVAGLTRFAIECDLE